jgi:hypothetical protein
MDPTTWFGSIDIEPEDMRFIAPVIRKDIAIVVKKDNQSILYLCTKEGECVNSQDDGFDKERFKTALKNGPAIYAEGGHARCLRSANQAAGRAPLVVASAQSGGNSGQGAAPLSPDAQQPV